MSRFRHHLFVCENVRSPDNPRGCCAARGGAEVRALFKSELKSRGLLDIRANAAGCLDACEDGVAVVIYPEGVWYGKVTPSDVGEIIDEHLIGGRPVRRLQIPGAK